MTVAAHRFVGRAIRWVLGAVFLVAAVAKLAAVHRVGEADIFAALTGASIALRFAICIGEALLGLWLLVGLRPRAASIATLAVCSTFLGIIGSELRKPAPRDCGCFGIVQQLGPANRTRARLGLHVALDASMMILAATALRFSHNKAAMDSADGSEDVVVAPPESSGVLAG
jgi:uncharacterized membrane protein YphA (DoxX/SURF4 family)